MFLPIAHFDLDAFFASVEQKLNPELQGKPVIVCNVDPQGKTVNRGIVSTASYEARNFGVKSGMPVYQAKIFCPQGFFVKGNYTEYQNHSRVVFQLMQEFFPKVYQTNLDEGFINLEGCESLYPDSQILGQRVREKIKEKAGLNVSVGFASSRVLAKIACQLAKPNGLFIIEKSQEKKIIYPLSIKLLPGVGPKTEIILNSQGIKTIGDLIKNKNAITKSLGKNGVNLYLSALGVDNIWFQETKAIKSIGRSTTFAQNTLNPTFILATLFKLCEEVFYELFERNFAAYHLSVNIRYPDFKNRQVGKAISSPSSVRELYEQAKELFFNLWRKKEKLRLVGIKTAKLESSKKQEENSIHEAVFYLRKKYGPEIIKSAFTIDRQFSI